MVGLEREVRGLTVLRSPMQLISQEDGVPGVIAISNFPVGLIAIGTRPVGIVAVGSQAVGVLSVGVLAAGLVSFGFGTFGLYSNACGLGLGGHVRAVGGALGIKVSGVGVGLGFSQAMVGSGYRFGFMGDRDTKWWIKAILSGVLVAAACLVIEQFVPTPPLPQVALAFQVLSVACLIGTPLMLWRSAANEAQEFEESEVKDRELQAVLTAAKARRSAVVHGTIQSVKRTGTSINDQPQLQILVTADLGSHLYEHTFHRVTDIVDIPRIQPGSKLLVSYDPTDLDNLHVDFDSARPNGGLPPLPEGHAGPMGLFNEPADEPDELKLTGVRLLLPPALLGLESPQDWLYAPRNSATPLVVMPLHDPHRANDNVRNGLVDGAHLWLVELLWAHTNISAEPATWVIAEHRRPCVGPNTNYEAIQPFFRDFEQRPIAVWGEAEQHLDQEGFTLRVRFPNEATTRTLGGPLEQLPQALISILTAAGACHATGAPPAWYEAVPYASRAAYCDLLDKMTLLTLRGNNFVDLPPRYGQDALDRAQAAIAAPGMPHQTRLLYLAMASRIAEAGELSQHHRATALGMIRNAAPGTVEHQLAPSFVKRLDPSSGEARALLAARTTGPGYRQDSATYQQWLGRLAASLRG